jgi:ATP-dependent helicase/DNAse subunit B
MKQLIVFPTSQLVRQYKRDMLKNEKGVTGELPVTYEFFVDRCIDEIAAPFTFIGDFKKNLLLQHIFSRLIKQLRYFKSASPGYCFKIGEIIGELKREDMSPAEFRDLVKNTPKNQDIYTIYSAYQKLLKKNRLIDREDRHILCKNYIDKSRFVASYDSICFKEFYNFSTIQKKIIRNLGHKAEICDTKMGFNINKITVVHALDRKTEAWNLAHTILDDLNNGLLPEEICIVLRNRELYLPYIYEAFKEAGIPVETQLTAPLIQNPFIKSLFAMSKGELGIYFDKQISVDDNLFECYGYWASVMLEYLEMMGFPQKFIQIHEGNVFLIKRDVEAFECLKELLQDFKEVEALAGKGHIDFDGFLKRFAGFVKNGNYSGYPPEKGIWLLSFTMLRGLKFKKAYVLGMIEGEFPRAYRPDWLLREEERALINDNGYDIDVIKTLFEREKESFYYLLSGCGEAYFSYPEVQESGSPTLISSYLEDLIHSDVDCEKYRVSFSEVFCIDIGKSFKSLQGVLCDEKTKDKIERYFNWYRFSITALNTYGQCPYKFFLARVLNLTPDIDETEFTALDRGIVSHKILEEFFKNHKQSLLAQDIEVYEREIDQIAESVMAEMTNEDAFLHPKIYEIEKQSIVQQIKTYIGNHIKSQGDFVPYLLEYDFGFDEDFFIIFGNKKVKLCGKIDRIDINPEGKIAVFDYKNSYNPGIEEVCDGTNFQMPIYIIAAQKLLQRPVVGGAFIPLKKGSVDNIIVRDRELPFVSKRKRKGILDEKQWHELLNLTIQKIASYVENIQDANFPIQPKKCPKIDKYSGFCDFTKVCPWEGE